MPHLTFLRDDLNEAETGDVAADERRPATETLAAFALEAALSPAQRRRIAATPPSPSSSRFRPQTGSSRSARRAGAWRRGVTWRRARRFEKRGPCGPRKRRVADRLARGDRVLGVSQSPARYLPSALVAAADLHVRLRARPTP